MRPSVPHTPALFAWTIFPKLGQRFLPEFTVTELRYCYNIDKTTEGMRKIERALKPKLASVAVRVHSAQAPIEVLLEFLSISRPVEGELTTPQEPGSVPKKGLTEGQ